MKNMRVCLFLYKDRWNMKIENKAKKIIDRIVLFLPIFYVVAGSIEYLYGFKNIINFVYWICLAVAFGFLQMMIFSYLKIREVEVEKKTDFLESLEIDIRTLFFYKRVTGIIGLTIFVSCTIGLIVYTCLCS